MKKILLLLVILLFAQAAWATEADQQVTVLVTVGSNFGLTVDKTTVDFGRVKPGQTVSDLPAGGLQVKVQSTTGNPWTLSINNLSELATDTVAIPNTKFFWYGLTTGKGDWRGKVGNAFSTSPALSYSGLPGESEIKFKYNFKLMVPENQSPGVYESTVVFTLTE